MGEKDQKNKTNNTFIILNSIAQNTYTKMNDYPCGK
jgi:hypothetical protein